MTSPPVASPVEHWTFQVDNPLRAPAEIRELAGSSRTAVEAGASPWLENEDVFFGEDLSQAEDEFEAYDAYEPSSEADAYEGSELAESELLEETPASEHPLASVFTLARLAFAAMAKGGWATAIATAVGTGLRDVNQLTNMVFWFKHPADDRSEDRRRPARLGPGVAADPRPDHQACSRGWLASRADAHPGSWRAGEFGFDDGRGAHVDPLGQAIGVRNSDHPCDLPLRPSRPPVR